MRRCTAALMVAIPLGLSLCGCQAPAGGNGGDGGGGGSWKFGLWTGGTQLRGINIHQRRIYPEIDSDAFGPGPFGPPYTQSDFDQLAALGANYVNISHPGLFTESPPYVLDETVQQNLDGLLDMIEQADMFAVITFRTGPGRSEFSFWGDPVDIPPGYVDNSVWESQAPQDAWAAQWRAAASIYKDNPVVVGYDLMCEPNSDGLIFDMYDPEEFFAAHGGTTYDWNQFHPRVTAAIREVDTETPILTSAQGWGSVNWLPYLTPTDDERTVYTAHQYEPQDQYTHQPDPTTNTYPGTFDTDYDDVADTFDAAWIANVLQPVRDFQAEHGAPVAINEFGAIRWEPGVAEFIGDEMDALDDAGVNYALWVWNPPSFDMLDTVDEFDYRFGTDPGNHSPVPNDLLDAITERWARNSVRPSTVDTE